MDCSCQSSVILLFAEAFFEANNFAGRLVADPFMGGGTPLIEANRVGCDVLGFDINPMAAWIVREEIEHLDVDAYRSAADRLLGSLEAGARSRLPHRLPPIRRQGRPGEILPLGQGARLRRCRKPMDLFTGYLLADDSRHSSNVLVCHGCGDLNEVVDLKEPGRCSGCAAALVTEGPARRGRCACPHCGHDNPYAAAGSGAAAAPAVRHRVFQSGTPRRA